MSIFAILRRSIFFSAWLFVSQCVGFAAGPRHVVIIVWDGMRPDFVNEQTTPALYRLAKEGVVFRNHHSVYPSATNVNGTAISTGAYPGHSGLIANHDYRPEIDAQHAIDVEMAPVVRKGDEISGGKYLAVPTIAELVQQHGGRTAVAAAKTVGLLLDRQIANRGKDSATLFAGQSLPPAVATSIVKNLGPFPAPPKNRFAQGDAWTTRALTEFFWRDDIPAFSFLWLSEPDATQHQTAPGSPAALEAIKSADDNLARLLSALDRHHARGDTDILVVSDHGFSTIRRSIDLLQKLKGAGFDVVTALDHPPKSGQIMAVGNGGTVLFYIIGNDIAVAHRLVEFLQQSDFAGAIFTKQKMEGAFTLDQGGIDTPHAPDVAMAFRWDNAKNQFGVAGMIDADWQRAAGEGTHATLSRYDMHNTLIGAGPDFRRGQVDDLPTGNVDLAPTVAKLLGLGGLDPCDGRVLSEALAIPESSTTPKVETSTVEAARVFADGTWRQSLTISRVGSTTYLDNANGGFTPEIR